MKKTQSKAAGIGQSRRSFLAAAVTAGSALSLGLESRASESIAKSMPQRDFKISLAAWSLHRALFSNLIQMTDLPQVARQSFGIDAIELVNQFFRAPTDRYLKELKTKADAHGVKILLIMVDGEGSLGHSDDKLRKQAIRNHFKWVDIAQQLGCHCIRVNMHVDDEATAWNGQGWTPGALNRLASAFTELTDYAKSAGLKVTVENHGGVSSNADALVQVMKAVNSPDFGTLPDFGNFPEGVDKYESIRKMMPFAKAVSAKCHHFDEQGNETAIDYQKMIQIVVDEAGYEGYIGIEFEGRQMTEYSGIMACKSLLERVRGSA